MAPLSKLNCIAEEKMMQCKIPKLRISRVFLVKGSLIAGSETCPIDNGNIEIDLHGRRKDDVVQNPKAPHFTLSLHGKINNRSWIRLARTSVAGSDHILTQHEVDWVPGQQVVGGIFYADKVDKMCLFL